MDYFLATETWDLMDTVSEVEVGNVLKEKKSGMKYWFGCVKGQQTSSSLEGEALVFHIIQDYIVTIFFSFICNEKCHDRKSCSEWMANNIKSI